MIEAVDYNIMVSIRCLAYNHEKYIRDCLEGIVKQRTTFRYEAIVHDDASTDGTAAIIGEYAARYPDIIKPIYEKENQYSKHDGTISRVIGNACKGKYHALCECDDFWTDPLKLQKQIDFLETHPDFTLCFHGVECKAETGRQYVDYFGHLHTGEYSRDEIIHKWSVPTCSIVYPSWIRSQIPHNPNFKYGDSVLVCTCLKYGKCYCLGERMGVYRLSVGSWNHRLSAIQKNKAFLSHTRGLLQEFDFYGTPQILQQFKQLHFRQMCLLKEAGDKREFQEVATDYKSFFHENIDIKFTIYYFVFRCRKLLENLRKNFASSLKNM